MTTETLEMAVGAPPEQYVVTFGNDAALGCFSVVDPLLLRRGKKVLVETPRGLEVGSVSCAATIRQARLLGALVSGRLIRPLTEDDDAIVERYSRLAREIVVAAEDLATQLNLQLAVLDAEVLFDGATAIVQILHPKLESLVDFAETLSRRFSLQVRLANLPGLVADEVEPAGCGKPDCGKTEGGGCSTCSTGGGCSSCGAPGKVDLKPYFAHLRDQMETRSRIPLA